VFRALFIPWFTPNSSQFVVSFRRLLPVSISFASILHSDFCNLNFFLGPSIVVRPPPLRFPANMKNSEEFEPRSSLLRLGAIPRFACLLRSLRCLLFNRGIHVHWCPFVVQVRSHLEFRLSLAFVFCSSFRLCTSCSENTKLHDITPYYTIWTWGGGPLLPLTHTHTLAPSSSPRRYVAGRYVTTFHFAL
jgi:hypothetical protein